MSSVGQLTQQLQMELRNELTTANQLLRLIYVELQQIKQFTQPNGEFESNVRQNASLMTTLANLQQVDLQNLPPMVRTHIDMENNDNGNNISHEFHDTFRDSSNIED